MSISWNAKLVRKNTTAPLWIAYAGMTVATLIFGNYLTLLMDPPEPIFFLLALIEAILAGVSIYRAGFLSLQTAILAVTFLMAHRSFDELIIFTVGLTLYS